MAVEVRRLVDFAFWIGKVRKFLVEFWEFCENWRCYVILPEMTGEKWELSQQDVDLTTETLVFSRKNEELYNEVKGELSSKDVFPVGWFEETSTGY